jgi:uncharacterized membrane protein YhaH (DUF805 family)
MDFMTAVRTCLNKYIDINGRASRSEYWWFVLASFIVLFVAGFVLGMIGLPFLHWIVWLAVLVPITTAGIRRLHDLDKPVPLIVLTFIPVVNFYMVYLFVQRGTLGPNQYGEDPVPQAAVAA